ncbi:MAG TPA: hypothetical protein VEA41_04290, partial [Salinarimonas sp.]|nr:hypothetical protein [Salinarimonas sp.]
MPDTAPRRGMVSRRSPKAPSCKAKANATGRSGRGSLGKDEIDAGGDRDTITYRGAADPDGTSIAVRRLDITNAGEGASIRGQAVVQKTTGAGPAGNAGTDTLT